MMEKKAAFGERRDKKLLPGVEKHYNQEEKKNDPPHLVSLLITWKKMTPF